MAYSAMRHMLWVRIGAGHIRRMLIAMMAVLLTLKNIAHLYTIATSKTHALSSVATKTHFHNSQDKEWVHSLRHGPSLTTDQCLIDNDGAQSPHDSHRPRNDIASASLSLSSSHCPSHLFLSSLPPFCFLAMESIESSPSQDFTEDDDRLPKVPVFFPLCLVAAPRLAPALLI
jgi:hypothetical protein